MICQNRIVNALSELVPWLETWRDKHGAYNGFVVHRFETKRMCRVHDTAWTQSAMIRGYGNLYRKSFESRWWEQMTLAADLLASRYDQKTGKIRHTGHEDDRFHSLVSCALGVCALLSVADIIGAERKKKYIQICAEHVLRYWFEDLWTEREGAFKFSEVDYWSIDEDRYVVNFNTMAAEALLAIYSFTGKIEFREKAIQVGEWLLKQWQRTQAVNRQILMGRATIAENPFSEWMAPGGFSYQFTDRKRDPDNYVTLYTGLSLRGFWALFKETKSQRFAEIIKDQSQYILAMRDPKTRLFYHTAWSGKIEKNPQFIAGAGMTLLGLHEVMPLIGREALPEDTVSAILNRVFPNGSYPGFIGKNETNRPGRTGGGLVWEDTVATINWNAQWFEYLTRLVVFPSKITIKPSSESIRIVKKRFIYMDSTKVAAIVSWWPPKSWGIYYYRKSSPVAQFAFYPVGIYGKLRQKYYGLEQ